VLKPAIPPVPILWVNSSGITDRHCLAMHIYILQTQVLRGVFSRTDAKSYAFPEVWDPILFPEQVHDPILFQNRCEILCISKAGARSYPFPEPVWDPILFQNRREILCVPSIPSSDPNDSLASSIPNPICSKQLNKGKRKKWLGHWGRYSLFWLHIT